MKKIIGFLTALLMLLSLGQFALAQPACTLMVLEGIVLEVLDTAGGYLLHTESDGDVMMLVNDDTIFEGQENLIVGDYVFVTFNGIMTRSKPPQVNAMKIHSYVIDGVVTSLDKEGNTMLVQSEKFGQVMIRLPDMDSLPQEGDNVRVYNNGVMALSYPGQVNGFKVDIYKIAHGVVSEIAETSFLMTGDAGIIRVNIDKTSRIQEKLLVGVEVDVYYSGIMTRSLPPQIFGVVINTSLSE